MVCPSVNCVFCLFRLLEKLLLEDSRFPGVISLILATQSSVIYWQIGLDRSKPSGPKWSVERRRGWIILFYEEETLWLKLERRKRRRFIFDSVTTCAITTVFLLLIIRWVWGEVDRIRTHKLYVYSYTLIQKTSRSDLFLWSMCHSGERVANFSTVKTYQSNFWINKRFLIKELQYFRGKKFWMMSYHNKYYLKK